MVGLLGRALVVSFIGALCVTAALASPERAAGQSTLTPFDYVKSGTPSPPGVPDYMERFYQRAIWRQGGWVDGEVSTLSNAERNVIFKRLATARVGAGVMPTFATFATRASIAVAGAYVGWKIYQHFTGGAQSDMDVWLDSNSLGANSLYNPCAAPPGVNCTSGDPDNLPSGNMMGWASQQGSLGGSNCYNDGTGLAFFASYKCEVGAAWVIADSVNNTAGGCFTSVGGLSPPCFVLNLNPIGYSTAGDARSALGGNNCSTLVSVQTQYSSCRALWSEADAAGALTTVFPNQSQPNFNSQWPSQLAFADEQTQNGVLASVPGAIPVTTASYAVGSGTVTKRAVVITLADLQSAAIVFDPGVNPGGAPDQTYDYNEPAPYTQAGDVGSSSQTAAALAPFDNVCGKAFLNALLAPELGYRFDPQACSWTAPVPTLATFPLVQPLVNETYSDYLQRLRDYGWLGTATSTEVAPGSEVPEMGPLAVTGVSVGSQTYVPGSWPSPAPKVGVNTSLTLEYNPAGLGEAPGGGEPLPPGSSGVPVPTGALGDWCKACPPVDFSPLTSLDYGSSFPFGVIPWLSGWIGSLTTTADAPVFDFDYTSFSAGGFGPYNLGHYTVDLTVLDPYMTIVRTILAWCVWIVAVWWFGSSLVGFRGSGDPGAAVDEAWS